MLVDDPSNKRDELRGILTKIVIAHLFKYEIIRMSHF